MFKLIRKKILYQYLYQKEIFSLIIYIEIQATLIPKKFQLDKFTILADFSSNRIFLKYISIEIFIEIENSKKKNAISKNMCEYYKYIFLILRLKKIKKFKIISKISKT
jgi:hypothetical protein